jgi:hypothetical protein
MDTQQKIELAQQILGAGSQNEVTMLKPDKSIIERTMTEKIILTSDNRELLTD